ncbi:MAG: hypothetical protein ACE5HI_02055 [bacterium]
MDKIPNLLKFIQDAWQWLNTNFVLGLALFVGFILVRLFFRTQKNILFEAWVNQSNDKALDIGNSLADLLLFKIREIQSIHQRSIRQVGLWAPYYDIPAFNQGLDEDINFLASIELGGYGNVIHKLVTLLFRLVPYVLKPAKIGGNIHKYGEDVYFQVTLENVKDKKRKSRMMQVWQAKGNADAPEQYPTLIEELAYQIYLGLAKSDLFKSWQSFRSYTLGLNDYLQYMDLHEKRYFDASEKNYDQAIKLQANNPATYYNLAVLKYYCYKKNDNEKAIANFQKALLSEDESLRAQAHSGLANALCQRYTRFKLGNQQTLLEAIDHAQRAQTINREMDIVQKALAFAYHIFSEIPDLSDETASKYRKMAIKHYTRAFQINSKYYVACNNLGNLYLEWAIKMPPGGEKRKTLMQAIQACTQAIKIQNSYHHAYDNIGNAYYELQQFDLAQKYYLDALKFKTDYWEAKNDLAMLYLTAKWQQANPAEALKLHDEVVSNLTKEPTRRAKMCKAFQKRFTSLDEVTLKLSGKRIEVLKNKHKQHGCPCFDVLLDHDGHKQKDELELKPPGAKSRLKAKTP